VYFPTTGIVSLCHELANGTTVEVAATGNDGMVDQREFDMIFANVKRAMQNKKNDREVKRMIVTVMEETGNNKVKTGWFSNWYTTLKKDLGL
jgi:hypothetical protein